MSETSFRVPSLALSFGVEIVVFSPARRASRKLLERMVEFIRLLCAALLAPFRPAVSAHPGTHTCVRVPTDRDGDDLIVEARSHACPCNLCDALTPAFACVRSTTRSNV